MREKVVTKQMFKYHFSIRYYNDAKPLPIVLLKMIIIKNSLALELWSLNWKLLFYILLNLSWRDLNSLYLTF